MVIKSKPASQEYKEGWERIFGKKDGTTQESNPTQEQELPEQVGDNDIRDSRRASCTV